MSKVIEIDDAIVFDDGFKLYSEHNQDCCESHYLDFSQITPSDFEGLSFDLTGEGFFAPVEGYGIRLVPVDGHPISIPGYGSNNGYYSSNLFLVLSKVGATDRYFDVSECQVISG